MSPRYFQGKSVTGQVTASGARNFQEVVDKLRVSPTIPLTREVFLALPKSKRNEAKQVPYFTAAAFNADPCDRRYENATVCNLLFVDIDETKTGHCPAAPFASNPTSLYTALEGFNFAAHLTASSTPEKPRMRIVVDAEGIPLALYAQAVATVGLLLGLPHVTTESKVAVQPMFLPTLFADSTDEDEPLIAHRVDARAFTVKDITDEVPDDFTDSPRASQIVNTHSTDALFFLRAPVPEINLAVAKEALLCIDPDCSYHEWLECAAALRHQFSPRMAEEAYELFDEWSAQGSKYGSSEDTKAKWDSLRPTPVGRMPVTIRSLLRQAVQAGWDDTKAKDTSVSTLVEWMDTVKTSTELLEKGVQRILAAPLLSNMQESMMVDQLRATAKKRFLANITATAIRKDMDRLKAEIRSQERAKEKVKIPTWANGVCYVSAANEFYRHRTGERYKEASFNNSYGCKLLPTEDDLRELGKPILPATLATPMVEASLYALNHLKIPKLYDYAYDPSQPMEMVFVDRGKKFLNIYIPTYPELDHDKKEEAGDLFQGHLCNLIAEPEYRQTLLDFMAFHIQSAGRKIRWAVMIQGAEGCGKSYLAEVMKACLGRNHVKTIDGSAVKSGFNDWAFGHQLVVMEELRVAGSSRHEIMNALKPLLTNDEVSVNEKFRSQRNMPNISNYMMFTNHHDALMLTPNDRRYFVIKSPLQLKSQVTALGKPYFSKRFTMLKDHPGAMRAYLSEWNISPDFSPDGDAPRTKYAAELINDSASDLSAAVRKALLEGEHPLVQYDIVSSQVLLAMIQNDEGIRATPQQLAHVLREEQMHQVGRTKIGEERHYLWARQGVNGNAVTLACERVKKNQKNLQMEVIFS